LVFSIWRSGQVEEHLIASFTALTAFSAVPIHPHIRSFDTETILFYTVNGKKEFMRVKEAFVSPSKRDEAACSFEIGFVFGITL